MGLATKGPIENGATKARLSAEPKAASSSVIGHQSPATAGDGAFIKGLQEQKVPPALLAPREVISVGKDGHSKSPKPLSSPPPVSSSTGARKPVDALPTAAVPLDTAGVRGHSLETRDGSRQVASAHSVSFAVRNAGDMDIDEADAKRTKGLDSAALFADRHISGDTKASDIPSSPDSTVQTATTPAVHDISVNTSPENENENDYVDRDENTDRRGSESKVEEQAPVDDLRDDTVEAQLLQESAAAGENRTDDVTSKLAASQTGPSPATLLAVTEAEAVAHVLPSAMGIDGADVTSKAAVSLPTSTTAVSKGLTVDSPSVLAALPTPKPSTGDADETLQLSELVAASSGKDKRRAPTVLLGKKKKRKAETAVTVSNLAKSENLFAEDYFTPLFVQTFAQNSKWLKTLDQLVHHARKTISSADNQASIFDSQSFKILKRVYQLQQQDKWSLRQPKRVPELPRPKSHWDVLIQEMKWMRTDFREERKWKTVAARNLAVACAEWVHATPQERKRLQVNASIPPRSDNELEDIAMIGDMIDAARAKDEADAKVSSPKELADDDDFASYRDVFVATAAPSAIFALPDDAIVFGLNPSVASDRLLAELPLYGSPLDVPNGDLTLKDQDPDASWRRPVVPVSKYIETPIVIYNKPPPEKRSRYAVMDEDSDTDVEEFVDGASPSAVPEGKSNGFPAPDHVIGLVAPSLRPVRERLHSGHQFRPPSEYPMPVQSFYEYRPPSQWTVANDDQLKKLVREYSYNWSLISSILTTKSIYGSGAERRTPWECFERWISLEGYPTDASRSPYFRVYQARIDAAQRTIKDSNEKAMAAAAAAAASAAQANANGNISATVPQTPIRRRPTLAIRVERHRNQKHLALFEAMRKLAKKREAMQLKQQQQAAIVASRKANEAPQQRVTTRSPREYSKIRHERDVKMAERVAEYTQRQTEAHRRVGGFIKSGDVSVY